MSRDNGLPAQAPEGEAQAAVGVQADGDLAGGVELTLQLDGAAQGTGSSVGHLTGRGRRQRHIREPEAHLQPPTCMNVTCPQKQKHADSSDVQSDSSIYFITARSPRVWV